MWVPTNLRVTISHMQPALLDLPGRKHFAPEVHQGVTVPGMGTDTIRLVERNYLLQISENRSFGASDTHGHLEWWLVLLRWHRPWPTTWIDEEFTDPVSAAQLYRSIAWVLGDTLDPGMYNEPCENLLGYLSLPVATEVVHAAARGRCRAMRRVTPDGRTHVLLWFTPHRRSIGIRRVSALESAQVRSLLGGILIWYQFG